MSEVFRLDSNEESIELTQVFSLPDIDHEVSVPLTPLQAITIERDPPASRRRTDPPAFCFHDWCYEVLQSRTNECHKSVIFKLARTLILDPTTWVSVCEQRQDFDSVSILERVARIDKLLSIPKLPAELERIIWQYSGLSTPYAAAVIVAHEPARLARHLRCSSSRYKVLERGSRISAQMISIFGTEYIQDLNVNRDSEGHLVGDITEVKFTSSLVGICAVQLLGVNWKTDWIGKIPSADYAWHGMIRGRVLSLQCEYNVSC
jgi:hypothetical protein